MAERSGWEEFPGALPSWARAFPGTAEQVGAARRFVAGLLEGSSFRDDAVMVLSELFTNALLHTASGKPGGLVVVQVSRWLHGVRIAVTDQGSASQPVIRDPGCGEAAENGNGLYLAAHLARRLDWHDDASGRTVAAIFGQLAPQPHPCAQLPGPVTGPPLRLRAALIWLTPGRWLEPTRPAPGQSGWAGSQLGRVRVPPSALRADSRPSPARARVEPHRTQAPLPRLAGR
ncbi:MAG: ATP-binding protein [Streptosporangiales bacterium]